MRTKIETTNGINTKETLVSSFRVSRGPYLRIMWSTKKPREHYKHQLSLNPVPHYNLFGVISSFGSQNEKLNQMVWSADYYNEYSSKLIQSYI